MRMKAENGIKSIATAKETKTKMNLMDSTQRSMTTLVLPWFDTDAVQDGDDQRDSTEQDKASQVLLSITLILHHHKHQDLP